MQGEAAGIFLGMLDGWDGRCDTSACAFVEVPIAYSVLF